MAGEQPCLIMSKFVNNLLSDIVLSRAKNIIQQTKNKAIKFLSINFAISKRIIHYIHACML